MRSDLIKLAATIVIWGVMAFIITEVNVSEGNVFPLLLTMGIVAAVSTMVVWVYGGRGDAAVRETGSKAKRIGRIPTLIDNLDDQELAELEGYLQSQRESRLREQR